MGKTVIDPTKDRTDEDDTGTEEEEGAESDADDEEEEGAESDADDEEEDDEPDEAAEKALLAALTPEQRKYVKALQGRVTKANAQSAAKRRQLVELRKAGRKAPVVKPTEPPKKTGDAPDFAAALAQFKAEAAEERRIERVQIRAADELRKAGLALDPNDSDAADRKLARAIKLLDLEDLEPNEVADAVADLRADSPELFKRRRKVKPRTGGVSGPARAGGGGRAGEGAAASMV
jgi:hypothetical protein